MPELARKLGLDLGLLLVVFQSLPVQWVGGVSCGGSEEVARRRMAGRDEEDWPTVALTLTLAERRNVPVWSHDKDFSVSGLEVVTHWPSPGPAGKLEWCVVVALQILLQSQQPTNPDAGGNRELGPQREGLVNS